MPSPRPATRCPGRAIRHPHGPGHGPHPHRNRVRCPFDAMPSASVLGRPDLAVRIAFRADMSDHRQDTVQNDAVFGDKSPLRKREPGPVQPVRQCSEDARRRVILVERRIRRDERLRQRPDRRDRMLLGIAHRTLGPSPLGQQGMRLRRSGRRRRSDDAQGGTRGGRQDRAGRSWRGRRCGAQAATTTSTHIASLSGCDRWPLTLVGRRGVSACDCPRIVSGRRRHQLA